MNLRSIVNHLEAGLATEIESKRAALDWIGALEQALGDYAVDTFEAVVERGGALAGAEMRAAKRREKLIAELAKAWQVPAGTLTLGSIVRRLEPEAGRLPELRAELRELVGQVLRRRRRLSALIGLHQRVNADMMQLILGCETQEQVNRGGSLVDAEA